MVHNILINESYERRFLMSGLSTILAYVNKIRIDNLELQGDILQEQLNSIINLNDLVYENIGDDDPDSYWSGDLSDLHIDGGTF
jgi:hypothetical protein